MHHSKYSEIQTLAQLNAKHDVVIGYSPDQYLGDNEDYPACNVKLGDQSFEFFVDDEYGDRHLNNPLLDLCLVLRELEGHAHASDYLIWCQERNFNADDEQIRANHMNLAKVYREIEAIIGKIDSQVSDYDFELGGGPMYELRPHQKYGEMPSKDKFKVPCIKSNESFVSVFDAVSYPKNKRGGMLLTDRIDALNLRIRESEPGYVTDWHVAGDPTLIVVQQGVLRITLRDGNYQDFGEGSSFIAQDYLPEGIEFNPEVHGHKAEVLGGRTFKATHIKLSSRID